MPTLRNAGDPAFEDATAARLAEAAAADAAEAAARAEAAAARLAEAAAQAATQAAAEDAARAGEPLPAAAPDYYAAKAAEEAAAIAADDAAAGAAPTSEPAAGGDDVEDEPFSPPQTWTTTPGDPGGRAADSERRDGKAPEHDRNAATNGGESAHGENEGDGAERAAPDSGMSAQADLMGSLASDGGMVGYGHGQADEHQPEHAEDHRREDLEADE